MQTLTRFARTHTHAPRSQHAYPMPTVTRSRYKRIRHDSSHGSDSDSSSETSDSSEDAVAHGEDENVVHAGEELHDENEAAAKVDVEAENEVEAEVKVDVEADAEAEAKDDAVAEVDRDGDDNEEGLQLTVPLSKMNVADLKMLATRYNIHLMVFSPSQNKNRRRKKQELLDALLEHPTVNQEDQRLRSLLSRRITQAREVAQASIVQGNRQYYDNTGTSGNLGRGRPVVLQICISKRAQIEGEQTDVPDRLWDEFIKWMVDHCIDGGVAWENAPDSNSAPHRHLQSVVTIPLVQNVKKAYELVKKDIAEVCHIPADEGFVISVTKLNRRGGESQNKELVIGYTLKERGDPGWKYWAHNLSDDYLQSCLNKYLAVCNGATQKGKIIHRPTMYVDMETWYRDHNLKGLLLPPLVIFYLMLRDGYVISNKFVMSYTKTGATDMHTFNALWRLNNRPSNNRFDLFDMIIVLFGDSWTHRTCMDGKISAFTENRDVVYGANISDCIAEDNPWSQQLLQRYMAQRTSHTHQTRIKELDLSYYQRQADRAQHPERQTRLQDAKQHAFGSMYKPLPHDELNLRKDEILNLDNISRFPDDGGNSKDENDSVLPVGASAVTIQEQREMIDRNAFNAAQAIVMGLDDSHPSNSLREKSWNAEIDDYETNNNPVNRRLTQFWIRDLTDTVPSPTVHGTPRTNRTLNLNSTFPQLSPIRFETQSSPDGVPQSLDINRTPQSKKSGANEGQHTQLSPFMFETQSSLDDVPRSLDMDRSHHSKESGANEGQHTNCCGGISPQPY